MQRRVVEHERCGVMFVKGGVAVFRQELDRLVRREQGRVAIDGVQVIIPGQEILPVRHALARGMALQGTVSRIRIVQKGGCQG